MHNAFALTNVQLNIYKNPIFSLSKSFIMCFIFVLPYTSTYNTVHAWKSARTRYLMQEVSLFAAQATS